MSHKIALSLSVTFLGHSLQGNIGSPCLLMLQLQFLEFILPWPLLFLERWSRWQPSIFLVSTSIPDSLQMLITVFSKSSSQILIGMPDNSTLFLWLYYSPFAWFFSKFMILSSNLLLTFFVITISLVSFLFSAKIWSIPSKHSPWWRRLEDVFRLRLQKTSSSRRICSP